MTALIPEEPLRGEVFARTLLEWQAKAGRHTLPWQNTGDPYKVWLSEVMLQQTQVATVLAYFERFLQAFPTVRDLAAAPSEQVMGLWAGLGYYSRARNLHACAKAVVQHFGGEFPRAVKDLASLPGIGESTAGAVASLAYGERAAILDGNVKRVFCRYYGIEGYPVPAICTPVPKQWCNTLAESFQGLLKTWHLCPALASPRQALWRRWLMVSARPFWMAM